MQKTRCSNDERRVLADRLLEDFDFGDDIIVADQGAWNTNDPEDLTKIIYVENIESESEGETSRISFHVRIHKTNAGVKAEAYALDLKTGNQVGSMGEATNYTSIYM